MDKTEKLKHIILSKYSSIREFSKIVEIPSTTLTSALDKGIGGMAVDRIIKICEVLDIDIKTFEPLNTQTKQDLSTDEKKLIDTYKKLNDLGKKEAHKRIQELSQISLYMYETAFDIAAHNDDLTEDENSIALQRALKAVLDDE